MAPTPTAPLVQLKSPFTGELFTVPPDWTPAFVDELVTRGFTRVGEPKGQGKRRDG